MPQIRKATITDIPGLVQLRIDFLNEMNTNECHPIPSDFEAALTKHLETAVPEGSFIAYIAEEAGAIIATSGVCFYRVVPNYSNPSGNLAYIHNMYTLPAWRRKGLATALLQQIIDEARHRGHKSVSLNATEVGRFVYEKLGFRGDETGMVLHL